MYTSLRKKIRDLVDKSRNKLKIRVYHGIKWN